MFRSPSSYFIEDIPPQTNPDHESQRLMDLHLQQAYISITISKINLAYQKLNESLNQLERLEKSSATDVSQTERDARRMKLDSYNSLRIKLADICEKLQTRTDLAKKNDNKYLTKATELYSELERDAKTFHTDMNNCQHLYDTSIRDINIKLGWQAIAYANSDKLIRPGSTSTLPGLKMSEVQKIYSEKVGPMRGRELTPSEILRQILRFDDDRIKILKKTVKGVKIYHAGNCGEYTALATNYLYKHNIPLIEAAYILFGDHAFVIIDRDPTSDINKPSLWGTKAVICDGLANDVYPASEIHRLKWYQPITSDTNNPNRYYPYIISDDKPLTINCGINTTYHADRKNQIFTHYLQKMATVISILNRKTIEAIFASSNENFLLDFNREIEAFKSFDVSPEDLSEHDLTRKADKVFKLLVKAIDNLSNECDRDLVLTSLIGAIILTHSQGDELNSFVFNDFKSSDSIKFKPLQHLALIKLRMISIINNAKYGTVNFNWINQADENWLKEAATHLPDLLPTLFDCAEMSEKNRNKFSEEIVRASCVLQDNSVLNVPAFVKYATENKKIFRLFRLAILLMIDRESRQYGLGKLIDSQLMQSNMSTLLQSRWIDNVSDINTASSNEFSPKDLTSVVQKYMHHKAQSSPSLISSSCLDKKSFITIFKLNEESDNGRRMELVKYYINENNDLLAKSLRDVVYEKGERPVMRYHDLTTYDASK